MTRQKLMARAFAVLVATLAAVLLGTSVASAAPSAQDRTWMVAAHQSNLAEIAAGQAAERKATSQRVRDLGAMFVRMHTALDADLKAAAARFGVSLPGTPNSSQRATLASVSAKSGAAFDSAWVTTQIAGHRDALAATQKEISTGSDATALKLANAARPVVQQHLTSLLALPQAPSTVQAGTGGQAVEAGSPVPAVLAVAGVLLLGIAVRAPRRARRRA